jgi:uncharacterized membrane-anchored protein
MAMIGGLIIWAINLQHRIEGVEGQLQEITAAMKPMAQQSSSSTSNACTNLAGQYATALGQGNRYGDSAAVSIRILMSDMGCMEPSKK